MRIKSAGLKMICSAASVLLCLLLFSCTSDKTPAPDMGGAGSPTVSGQAVQGTGAPDGTQGTTDTGGYALTLNPETADTRSNLYLGAKGFNLADAKIEWLVNGDPPYPGETTPTLKGGIAKKGFTVQAKVTVNGKEIKSNIIKIKNAPPAISKVKYIPEVFKPGDMLGVEVIGAADPDGDEVVFTYEWIKNNEPAGTGRIMDTPVKKGDKIVVKIIPSDGETPGRTITLNSQIRNMPPVINDNKEFTYDGKLLVHQLKAVDPDGDPLEYSLNNAPQGMTINSATGLITWNVPASFSGKGSLTAVVKDPLGGEATQVLNFDIGK
jgi:hypothetical protein